MFNRKKTISAAVVSSMSRIPLTERYEETIRATRRGLLTDRTSYEDAVAKRAKLERRIERLRADIQSLDGMPKEKRFFDWKHCRWTTFAKLLGDELYQADLDLFNVKIEEESTLNSIRTLEERLERLCSEYEAIQVKEATERALPQSAAYNTNEASGQAGWQIDPSVHDVPKGGFAEIKRRGAAEQDRRDSQLAGLSTA